MAVTCVLLAAEVTSDSSAQGHLWQVPQWRFLYYSICKSEYALQMKPLNFYHL